MPKLRGKRAKPKIPEKSVEIEAEKIPDPIPDPDPVAICYETLVGGFAFCTFRLQDDLEVRKWASLS